MPFALSLPFAPDLKGSKGRRYRSSFDKLRTNGLTKLSYLHTAHGACSARKMYAIRYTTSEILTAAVAVGVASE